MHKKRLIWLIGGVGIFLLVCAGRAEGVQLLQHHISSDAGETMDGMRLQSSQEFEGRLEFHKPILVNLVAGTNEHPQLAEVKWISFETTYGNAWGVTAKVGWSTVVDAKWCLTVELLDAAGRILRHPRDEPTIFAGKACPIDNPKMHYAELKLDAMHFQGRMHAARFRVRIDPAGKQPVREYEVPIHTFELTVVEAWTDNPVASASVGVTAVDIGSAFSGGTFLYTTNKQGECKIELPSTDMQSLKIFVQKDGYASIQKSWSNEGQPLLELPDQHTIELLTSQPIGGIVEDEQGNKISEAEITIQGYLTEESGTTSFSRSVESNTDGLWFVDGVPREIDSVTLRLKHAEYARTNSNLTGSDLARAKTMKHVELMKRGLSVSGIVLDSKEQPISGATVMMASKRGDSFSRYDSHVLTDVSGRFHFTNAKVYLTEKPSEEGLTALVAEAPGYAPAIKKVTVSAEVQPVEFHLVPGHTITGRVVDEKGQPIAHAWTVIKPFPDHKLYSVWLEDTDDEGRFRINNAPDNEILFTVGKKGYITVRDFVLGPSVQGQIVTMKPIVVVQGKVTDAETGEDIPDFEVIAGFYNSSNEVVWPSLRSSTRHNRGRYKMTFDEASPKSRILKVFADGYKPAVSRVIDIKEGNQSINFEIERDPSFKTREVRRAAKQPSGSFKIRGVVRDDKGEPLPNAVVKTIPPSGREVTTDAKGKFTFWSGINREDVVYVIIRHMERNMAAAVEINEEIESLDIKLEPGVILSGKVTDIHGEGIGEAEISLTLWFADHGYGSREKEKTSENGSYEIRAVPAGFMYSIYASAEGYGEQYVQVHTSDAVNNQIDLERLVLAPADLSISGLVIDQEDRPVADVKIFAHGRGQPNRETITDENGKFLIEKVCRGTIEIQANVRGEKRLHGRVKTEGGASDIKIVLMELDSRGRSIPKQPVSLIGKALPGFEGIDIEFDAEQAKGKKLLVCFFDIGQRPSRHCVRELAKKAGQLKEKGITIAAIQASRVDEDKLNEWVEENNVGFAVGMIRDEEEETLFNWGVKRLPWLILTDEGHIVRAEGFGPGEVDEKIRGICQK